MQPFSSMSTGTHWPARRKQERRVPEGFWEKITKNLEASYGGCCRRARQPVGHVGHVGPQPPRRSFMNAACGRRGREGQGGAAAPAKSSWMVRVLLRPAGTRGFFMFLIVSRVLKIFSLNPNTPVEPRARGIQRCRQRAPADLLISQQRYAIGWPAALPCCRSRPPPAAAAAACGGIHPSPGFLEFSKPINTI